MIEARSGAVVRASRDGEQAVTNTISRGCTVRSKVFDFDAWVFAPLTNVWELASSACLDATPDNVIRYIYQ